MKKVRFAVYLLVVLSICLLFESGLASRAATAKSRLGLKGKMVLVVTQVAPFVGHTEIEAGDVLTDVLVEGKNDRPEGESECDLTTITDLQKVIAESGVGTPIQIDFLRFNPRAGDFESHTIKAKTVTPPGESRSTIGLIGEMGFLVKDIDSMTPQAEVRTRDIIVSVGEVGQVTDLKTLRDAIITIEGNATVKAEILRFNSNLKEAERKTISLKVFPMPTAPMPTARIRAKFGYSLASTSTASQGVHRTPVIGAAIGAFPTRGHQVVVFLNVKLVGLLASQVRLESGVT